MLVTREIKTGTYRLKKWLDKRGFYKTILTLSQEDAHNIAYQIGNLSRNSNPLTTTKATLTNLCPSRAHTPNPLDETDATVSPADVENSQIVAVPGGRAQVQKLQTVAVCEGEPKICPSPGVAG